jgi:putative endonuclease
VPWFFYVVRCSDDSLYAGVTTDLRRRVAEHNSGKRGAKYTRSRRPVRLVYSKQLANRSEAQQKEASFKKLTRKQKLEIILNHTFEINSGV